METSLAALLPSEVLDRVGHVERRTVHAERFEGVVKHGTGRSHEGTPHFVLGVARLFAHDED